MRIRDLLLSLPKSIYFCIKMLPFNEALKLPIYVSYRTKFKSLKGKIFINEENIRPFMVRVGYGGSGTASFKPSVFEIDGTLMIRYGVYFGGGVQICIARNAALSVGRNTHFMGECHIVARKNISFGENCAISWNTQFMDTDMHEIKSDRNHINPDKPVSVGDRVWICSGAKIFKGSVIQDDTVVAANALITKKIEQGNCVVTGMPFRILKSEITWAP